MNQKRIVLLCECWLLLNVGLLFYAIKLYKSHTYDNLWYRERKSSFFLAFEPLWFLETFITEVACGASASKSSVQDALPSDSLPGGHQEVTLKYTGGRADTLKERWAEWNKEGRKKEGQWKGRSGQTSKREAKFLQGGKRDDENSAAFWHNVQLLIYSSVICTQNSGWGIKHKLLMDVCQRVLML